MPRKPGLQGSGQKILECGSSHLRGLHCMDLSLRKEVREEYAMSVTTDGTLAEEIELLKRMLLE
jgi:hypothetical protein